MTVLYKFLEGQCQEHLLAVSVWLSFCITWSQTAFVFLSDVECMECQISHLTYFLNFPRERERERHRHRDSRRSPSPDRSYKKDYKRAGR